MTEGDRWRYINELDNTFLKGGVILSEWCSFIIGETDTAFVAQANLATIVTAMAGIETYLRSEYAGDRRVTLFDLIEQSPLRDSLKRHIHDPRTYRNRWVHISDPREDHDLLKEPAKYEDELAAMAKEAICALRRTIYENQWV